MKYKIKIITGFRRDQEYSIDANEAHKAYYLFDHSDERGTFDNGIAIKGDQIQEIVPDYIGTMGWNPSYTLMSDDWEELNRNGVTKKLQQIMNAARQIAKLGEPADLNTPLSELMKNKYPKLSGNDEEERSGGMKRIGSL